jgi:citrate synthase
MDTTANLDDWVTAREAARLLGISRATLWRYIPHNVIRTRPGPGHRRYFRPDVQRLLEPPLNHSAITSNH